jgi:phospholipid/cholesterol/gamma-HCH transport system permease protein
MGAVKDDAAALLTFHGELLLEMARSLLSPRSVRWSNVFSVAETAGVNAVPIVSLVSFLVGLIIAFQAAMLMKIFGAEIYVADLIGLAVIRELGPLISGIVLAGRSGSAFSAELAAMKAAEEVDAISTMGLSPVRELALPRVLAALITTPMVTVIASFMGVLGGSFVLLAMGYAPGVYWAGAISQVSMAAFFIGIFKSFVFGFTMAAVGCQRGLAAGDGPGAVGMATTSGVVANIVLIVVLDSLFAVVFYVLDI